MLFDLFETFSPLLSQEWKTTPLCFVVAKFEAYLNTEKLVLFLFLLENEENTFWPVLTKKVKDSTLDFSNVCYA